MITSRIQDEVYTFKKTATVNIYRKDTATKATTGIEQLSRS